MNQEQDEKVKDRSWNREFQYLLDRKILSRDEMAYLLGQIDSLLSKKEKKIEVWKDLYEEYKQLWNEGEIRIKELEKLISDGVLKDHDGCQIYRDEEYTKLESQFREKEKEIEKLNNRIEGNTDIAIESIDHHLSENDKLQARIKELEKIISKKDDRIIQLVQDVNEADGMHMAELEKKWDLNNKIEKLEIKIKEVEEGIEKYRNRWHTITRTGDEELYNLIKK